MRRYEKGSRLPGMYREKATCPKVLGVYQYHEKRNWYTVLCTYITQREKFNVCEKQLLCPKERQVNMKNDNAREGVKSRNERDLNVGEKWQN